MPIQGTMKGKEAIRRFYESLPGIYPEHFDDYVDSIMAENKAAVRVIVRNKTRKGKELVFDAVSWMSFENGKIKSIHAFFDSAKLLKDLKG
jgi:ketosteroid isomerase-like protein